MKEVPAGESRPDLSRSSANGVFGTAGHHAQELVVVVSSFQRGNVTTPGMIAGQLPALGFPDRHKLMVFEPSMM